MRTTFALSALSAALLLSLSFPAESGGGGNGGYMGGGGGRGMSGGGFGGGMGRAGGMGGGSMGGASYGAARAPAWGNGGGRWNGGNGNWNGGNGNWHGGHGHGYYHGSYWGYGGWYYPYWGWWWPGLTIAAAWPYWYGYYGYPYAYDPGAWSYGAPSGTIIYRSGPDGAASAPNPSIRLFCPSTNAYYPDVHECSDQWLKVLPPDNSTPVPPPVETPTPQSYTPRTTPPATQTNLQRAPATQSSSPWYPSYAPRSAPPAAAPSNPVNTRSYESTASLDSGFVRTSTRTEIASTARPMAASYTQPAVTGVVASHTLPSAVGTKIPAPRMDLPRKTVPGVQVAEGRVD